MEKKLRFPTLMVKNSSVKQSSLLYSKDNNKKFCNIDYRMDSLLRSKEATEPSLKGLFTTAHLQFNAKIPTFFVKK
jgi:hypothetical protein